MSVSLAVTNNAVFLPSHWQTNTHTRSQAQSNGAFNLISWVWMAMFDVSESWSPDQSTAWKYHEFGSRRWGLQMVFKGNHCQQQVRFSFLVWAIMQAYFHLFTSALHWRQKVAHSGGWNKKSNCTPLEVSKPLKAKALKQSPVLGLALVITEAIYTLLPGPGPGSASGRPSPSCSIKHHRSWLLWDALKPLKHFNH